jgi:hypothetical protein
LERQAGFEPAEVDDGDGARRKKEGLRNWWLGWSAWHRGAVYLAAVGGQALYRWQRSHANHDDDVSVGGAEYLTCFEW